MFAYCCSINAQNLFVDRIKLIVCRWLEQKQKYSNAIEKQSMKSTTAAGLNGSSHLGIRKDISVKHLVSKNSRK